jgi:hypothetical protein
MMQQRTILTVVMVALVILLVGTSSVLAQEITCKQCHDDTTRITGKKTAWNESTHGSGDAYLRGTSSRCAGCHSGGAFSQRIAAGLAPDQVEAGDPNPTRQDCRACHQIHTSYTSVDFDLETTDPVTLFTFEDVIFDGGKGNLCANCHQPRRTIAAADPNGNIAVTSTHWGPHHGAESSMLLGLGGAGDVVGFPSAHAMLVRNTCVTCHMGADRIHKFEPVLSACHECHPDLESFDRNGVQTEIQAMLNELEAILLVRGLLDEEGHPAVAELPEAEAIALWNWILIAHEDGSKGVHNPDYTKALLEASLAALQQ